MYIIGTALSALFYHLGGMGGAWWKSSWVRDWLCPLVVLATLYLTGMWHWSLWLCYPLMIGASSTYWKVLNKYFNKPTTDCYWFNWCAHGIGWGLALLPYGFMMGSVEAVVARALILGLCMALWSSVIVKWLKLSVAWDEGGRGGLIICTLPLL